ncbi:MAG: hypothetical protein KDE27_22320 [Planctomycetes bacterium]|nr:hypothetical protein [Planctomycetota bacterium]
MIRLAPVLFCGLAAALLSFAIEAQDPGRGPGGRGRRGPGRMPMQSVTTRLDTDGNGELSAGEVEGAAAALRALDGNGDGELSRAELMPDGGRGRRGRRDEGEGPPDGPPGFEPPEGVPPEGGPPAGGFPGGGFPGGPGGMRFPDPVLDALDVDRDGVLSADEIDEAGPSLLTLDRDDDGALAEDELMPRFGPGRRGGFPGGPGGGFPGGPGGRIGRDRGDGRRVAPEDVERADGVAIVPDRATFEELSYQGEEVMIDTQLANLEFVKFIVADAGSDHPAIYFMNTNRYRAHPMFAQVVGVQQGFGRRGGDESRSMMGVLVYRPRNSAPDGSAGLYTFEFEPNDAYSYDLVKVAFELLTAKAPVVAERLAYHVMDGARRQFERDRDDYERAALPVFLPEARLADLAYLPLHQGEGYGRLRLMQLDERPGIRDIVVYTRLPNELPRVAGILTGEQQTPLSHVNLRAVQDDVPNAFVRGVAENAAVNALYGKYVHYRVDADGYTLREASREEVEAHFAAMRPATEQVPTSDLSVTAIRSLDAIGFADAASVGVKAANLAAMHHMDLPAGLVPAGYAVPFAGYDAFMRHNGLFDRARTMIADPEFRRDAERRERDLTAFRAAICAAEMPSEFAAELAELQSAFPSGTRIRCRSSTNNEDLPGFSGAGLYDSFTHKPSEGHLAHTIQQVYASLWNFRAFEEREFHRVDHFATMMAVLVHENFRGELANGVAVSDDIVYRDATDPRRRYYVNVQVGEDLVTNPEGASLPEELVLDPRDARLDQVVRRSNRTEEGTAILTAAQAEQLRADLRRIHSGFRKLYGKSLRDRFAIEIEFKITAAGKLAIKQARPWVY